MAERTPIHTGGCQCGAITYEITADPIMTYACHCTICQTQSGSAFGMAAVFDGGALLTARRDVADAAQDAARAGAQAVDVAVLRDGGSGRPKTRVAASSPARSLGASVVARVLQAEIRRLPALLAGAHANVGVVRLTSPADRADALLRLVAA